MAKKRTVRRRKKTAPKSVGLAAADTRNVDASATASLERQVEADGGVVLASYREPFGGTPVLLAALPIDRVEPTPFQRDPSEPHVKRLMNVIETLGRFLDPIIATREHDQYWTPNGNHRLQAMRKLGAQTVVALLVPDRNVAFKILALNTEKAHNLKEKSLETIRMLRALAESGDKREEREFVFEFDQPSFLTLGAAYEQRPRLSGGAYQSLLRRIDDFLSEPLPRAMKERLRRANEATGHRRSGRRHRPEAEGAWAHQSLPSAFRRRADQPDPVFHLHGIRFRRRDESNGSRGRKVQDRQDQAGRCRPRRRRRGGGRRGLALTDRRCG